MPARAGKRMGFDNVVPENYSFGWCMVIPPRCKHASVRACSRALLLLLMYGSIL